MLPRVYIVILNYKGWQDVIECLESVLRSNYDNYRVFVIDNNSQNNSLEYLIAWADTMTAVSDPMSSSSGNIDNRLSYKYFQSKDLSVGLNLEGLPKLSFVQNEENRGFAAGNNLVLQYLLKEDAYIWLLNPDMVVVKHTLWELVNFAGKHPLKSVIGCSVKFYSNQEKVYLYGGAKINLNSATVNLITEVKDIPTIDYICGGSMFAHAGHFNDIGLLSEDYFLYWEETDWCYQAKGRGYKMLVCTTAVCYDKISTTIGKSFLADYYYTRNGLLFTAKFKKKKVPLVLFSAVLRLIKRAMAGQWKRSKGVYKGIIAFLNRKQNENK